MTFMILGKPIPMKRPRLGKGHTYNPQKKDKDALRLLIKNGMAQKGDVPLKGPLMVKFIFYLPIPASTPKKINLQGEPHWKKPDLDNLVKFYLDVLSGLAFEDDSQVVGLLTVKLYGKNPRILISVQEDGKDLEQIKDVYGEFNA